MKLLTQFFFLIFNLLQVVSIENCNKMWGMTNEINGVQVSKIGIYMCIDDPLNIYKSSLNTDSSNIILNNKDSSINKNTLENILNYSNISIFNISNITNGTSYITTTLDPTTTTTTLHPTTTTLHPTTTTLHPTSTTLHPTSTTLHPTSTTSNPTTTTLHPTSISSNPTTKTLHPTTTTSLDTTTKKIININNYTAKDNFYSKNSEEVININDTNNALIIALIITSILSVLCFCIICFIKKNYCLTKCSNLYITFVKSKKTNVSNVQSPQKKITPINTMPPVPKLITDTTTINISNSRPLTPVNNQRLKLSSDILNVTTPKTNEWYKNTFKNEINLFNDEINEEPPMPPKADSPKPYTQPINYRKNIKTHTKVKNTMPPKYDNKPHRKIPSKHEFRAYSNSWSKRNDGI